jgi:competence protein ComEA
MARPEGRAPFGAGGPGGGSAAPGARPRRAGDTLRRVRALVILLLLISSAMLLRALWSRRALAPPGVLVEIQGAVPEPGLYELQPGATMREAFTMAGAQPEAVRDPFADLPVGHGYRLVLFPDGRARVWLADERLLVGLPLDPNRADREQLEQLPGVGPSRAAAIIAERADGGPFRSVDELLRVKGIGPVTLEQLRPFLRVDGLEGGPRTTEHGPQESAP